MDKFFGNLHAVLGTGLVLAIILMLCLNGQNFEDGIAAGNAIMRWLHTFFGVLWIGLLYYFNFVQIPTMPSVPAELKPGVTRYIAPAALFWFRWAALATWLTGAWYLARSGNFHGSFALGLLSDPVNYYQLVIGIAGHAKYLAPALGLQEPYRLIGVGMWLGLIMAFNVWFLIWPNQKRALGIVQAEDDVKARSASVAMMASRTNLILSIPMLLCMGSATHGLPF